MQLRKTATVTRIPGFSETQEKTVEEWVCPDCDYFEDASDNY
jgi:hypothetical protein